MKYLLALPMILGLSQPALANTFSDCLIGSANDSRFERDTATSSGFILKQSAIREVAAELAREIRSTDYFFIVKDCRNHDSDQWGQAVFVYSK